MDPTKQIVFRGADRDAEVLRERLNQIFNLAPQGSIIQDPQRREKFGRAAEHVGVMTAELAAVTRALPGMVGRAFGMAISGVEKEPETGKVNVGQGTAANFAPSPLGLLDPTAIGLSRNFYLPGGSSRFIPSEVDRLGLGLPEQRAADTTATQLRLTTEANSRQTRAQQIAGAQPVAVLEDLAAGRGGFTRAGVIFATSEVPFLDLQREAQRELLRRAASASIQPEHVQPVNDAARRNRDGAEGINRELVHERADP